MRLARHTSQTFSNQTNNRETHYYIMISFQALLSIALLAAFPNQAVGQEQRSLRILLNNGDDSGPVKCDADDVETIKVALWTEENSRRHLQFGPNDCPCDCECEGWAPGYCYWWFCHLVNPDIDRRALAAGLDEDTPLSECADHLVVVNNVLNSAMPMVSEDCKDVLRSGRAFSCQ